MVTFLDFGGDNLVLSFVVRRRSFGVRLHLLIQLLRSGEAVTSLAVNGVKLAATGAVRQPQKLLPASHVHILLYFIFFPQKVRFCTHFDLNLTSCCSF